MRTLSALILLIAPATIFADIDIDSLMVDRQGTTSESFMRTLAIVGSITPNTCFKLSEATLVSCGSPIQVDQKTPFVSKDLPRVVVDGTWNQAKQIASKDANILGTFQTFETDLDELAIPIVPATRESLAYYGARLVSVGESIVFETEAELPITHVEVGHAYFSDYLMKEEYGGGFYVEYHDRPHFHFALDANASGFLVLGKLDESGALMLTGFRIPQGTAVYTPSNVIHSDATLIGKWLVVYSIAEQFSTALLRTRTGALVGVSSYEVSEACVRGLEGRENGY